MQLIESARVIHAGTMNASNPTVAAALATITVLETEQPYGRMFALGRKLMEGLKEAAAETGHQLLIEGPGPMFAISFSGIEKSMDYRDTLLSDKAMLGKFISGMHEKGVRIIGRGLWYISAAHVEEDIDHAVATARTVFEEI
jgi:glutamate-1-semialdehyde 2,1-aminomutase